MNQDDRSPRIIETASATTSPDNSNSGSFAYIITAVVLGLALVVSLAGAGCAAVVIAAAANNPSSHSHAYPLNGYDTFDDDYGDMDWNEFLQHYDDTYGNSGDSAHKESGSATVADVLDYDLAPYGRTIDNELSASAYAGVPSDVREFVRSLVRTDRDYAVQVVNLLNTAALEDESRTQSIADAVELCHKASAAFDAMEIPAIANDESGSVKDSLGSAKGKASLRWSLMAEEIELLSTSDEVDTSRLWDKDDEVTEATDDAAELLEDAMSQSHTL